MTTATDTNTTATPPAVTQALIRNPVRISYPIFEEDNIDLYFLIINNIKAVHGVTEKEIFLNVFSNLPMRVQNLCRHLLSEMPEDPMTQLKQIVDENLRLPLEDRIKKLLTNNSLGDRRPSEYLRAMKDLIGEKDAQKYAGLIKNQFLEVLPPAVAPFVNLLAQNVSVEDLAKAADKCNLRQPMIAQIHQSNSELEGKMEQLTAQVCRLAVTNNDQQLMETQRQMNELRQELATTNRLVRDLQERVNNWPNCDTYRNFERSKSRDTYDTRNTNYGRNNYVCYYHRKWGTAATRCSEGCKNYGDFSGNVRRDR